ncbi:hypothetical protein F5Y06DRAFT_228924 [Hypoxylon sp. FL0890]|nr:hypothetical protein F5Y06DRAFT_228924 [Hypoxylon sp. FL0890]
MLRQIFEQKRALLSQEIVEEFEARTTLIDSFNRLWEIFVNLCRHENAGEIICIIDALDECERTKQSQLTKALEQLHCPRSSERSTQALKVLLTSRPYVNIHRGVASLGEKVPTIHSNGEDNSDKISQEIDIFIKDRIRRLSKVLELSPGEQETFRQGVARVPHRTYLWAYLMFNVVEESIDLTKDHLKASLETLPQTIEEAYERILSRSPNQTEARRLLSIVVAAERPLSLN